MTSDPKVTTGFCIDRVSLLEWDCCSNLISFRDRKTLLREDADVAKGSAKCYMYGSQNHNLQLEQS